MPTADLIVATQRGMRAEMSEMRRETRDRLPNPHKEVSGPREAVTARQSAA